MKALQILKVGIIALCVLAVFQVGKTQAQFMFLGNPLVGKPAPDFALRSIDGKTQRLRESLTDSNGAIVFFWATWCPHCRTQIVELQKLKPAIEKDGIRIMVVDIGEEPAVVAAYLKQRGLSFDVLLDSDSAVAQEYQVVGVPTFYFINAAGTVTASKNLLPEDYKILFLK